VNETPVRLSRIASQFVHINPDSYDAFAIALTDSGKNAAKKLGVEQSEIDALKKTIELTEGDFIIMFGGDLSAEAQAILANSAATFGSDSRRVLLQPLPLHNNSVGANDLSSGKKTLADVLKSSESFLIGGSLSEADAELLVDKEFVVVQELFETATTAHADVILPAASFAEVDGTFTNNTGFVQRVRRAIDPLHQAKADWMITSMIADEMGVDFGYSFAATAVFKAIADSVPAYKGIRYPDLKDESNPVQVKHSISEKRDLSKEIEALKARVEELPESAEKITDVPKVGHKLHRLTTLTSKTPQFHLLAHGNPKPASLHISPLKQFDLNGTVIGQEVAKSAVEAEV
jgi:NADH dehydrogenase/NADH:ubiquinone oxidoreductase subunit G